MHKHTQHEPLTLLASSISQAISIETFVLVVISAFQRRSQRSKANQQTNSAHTHAHAVLWKGCARNVIKTNQFDIWSSKEVLFSSIVIRCRFTILTELTSTFARFIIRKRSIVHADGMRKSYCQTYSTQKYLCKA